MKQIPVFLLVVMFLAVLVYGILLQTSPTFPPSEAMTGKRSLFEPFVTSMEFCSGIAGAECPRFYNYLSPQVSFKALTVNDKKAKVQEYIDAYNRKKNDQFFKAMLESEQNAHLFTTIDSGSGGTEGQRTRGRGASVCPSSAAKQADGTIVLEPSGKTFPTMSQYLDHMTKLLNKPGMETCTIPEVKGYEGSLPGVLGGLGSGTPSSSQTDLEGRDRSVVNTAIQDLWDRTTGGTKKGGVTMLEQPGEQTSAQTSINKLDDYEYSRIYELDNQPRLSQLSQDAKNSLTNQYVNDWSVLPYSSDKKAAAEDDFIAGRLEDGFREPKTGIFFRNMEGVDIEPPNDDVATEREQKIMSAYKPTAITQHVVDDEMERVARVVAQSYGTDPDWEPVVEKRGKHQYTITELRPKTKKERYETEADSTPTIQQAQDANMLTGKTYGPQMTIVDNQRGDPFFDKAGVVDHDNNRVWKYNDFNKWTPGLERMFAPTNDTQAWF